MVLYREDRLRASMRVTRRKIVGMEVRYNRDGDAFEEFLQACRLLLECVERLRCFEVAQMLADEHLGAAGEGHGVFQMRAYGEQIRHLSGKCNGQRRIAARPPENHLPAEQDTDNRIVHVTDDRAVVYKKQIGDTLETGQGLMLVRADRFVAEITAGGNERHAGIPEQDVVQRAVRKQDAERWIAGGDIIADCRFLTISVTGYQDDRCFRCPQQPFFERGYPAEPAGVIQVRDHDGERLLFPVLAFAEPTYGL
jgi:hypothetical protein